MSSIWLVPPPAAIALTISGTSITSNAALGSGPSGPGSGGGVAGAGEREREQLHREGQSSDGEFRWRLHRGSSSGTFSYTYGGGSAEGGGLYAASGALTISSSAVDDNLAQGGPGSATLGGGNGDGGGIDSNAPLVLSNVTVAGNQAVGGTSTVPWNIPAYPGGGGGGGLSCGAATITNTVFTDNLAIGGADAAGVGGDAGAGGAGTGALDMTNCTFTGNQALGGAGDFPGIAEAGGLGVGSNGPNIEVSNTNIMGNSATGGSDSIANGNIGGGGGHWGRRIRCPFHTVLGATATFTSCTFLQDVAVGGAGADGADGEGGGMFVSGESTMVLSDCNFAMRGPGWSQRFQRPI